MTRDEIKALVRQVIVDMSTDYGVATEITAVGNVSSNISGYDGPLAPQLRRKLKDFEFTEEEDEEDD